MISKTKNFQKTITSSINFDGVGLHSGVKTSIKLIPAPCDFGIQFSYNNNLIPAVIENVDSTIRGTNLKKNKITIMTVEHLMSALYALEISNLKIEISNIEVPILDGTSKIFLNAIQEVGINNFIQIIKRNSISFNSIK